MKPRSLHSLRTGALAVLVALGQFAWAQAQGFAAAQARELPSVSAHPRAAGDDCGTYVIDKPQSKVEFCVSHFPFSQVRGEFSDFEGGFALDTDSVQDTHVLVSIRPGSVDTRNEDIDRLVRGEQFFDVESYPEITFMGTGIEWTGEKTAHLTGDLTLRGVTKPVSFEVDFEEGVPDPDSPNDTVVLNAVTEIRRSEFGMKDLLPVVSDTVRICLAIKARRILEGRAPGLRREVVQQ